MKIIIIYPYFIHDRIHEDDIRPVPMGVFNVAAVLTDNHYPVEVWNCHDMQDHPDRIKSALLDKRPDIIGFSILHGNRWGGIDIARLAKKLLPHVKIVFGGIGATLLWEHLLQHFNEIDYIVLKEGEYSFLKLIQWLDNRSTQGPDHIKGIAYRKDGIIMTPEEPEPIEDLDRLPVPATYFNYQHISTTRGCAWKCAFCGSPQFWDGKVRFRSAENVVNELELLVQKGISFFYFSDDTLTIDKKRVIQICRKIVDKKLPITWNAISRVDCVDEEILYWMRRAGCIQISFGVESGSEKIRRILNKKIRTKDIKKAFSLTRQYGILPRAYFIYGSPEETWDTIQETIDLMHEIQPLSVIFYILDLFPGTAIYEKIKANGAVTDDFWLNRLEDVMYFEFDSNLDQEKVLAFGNRLRNAFYSNVHTYVQRLELLEKKDLIEKHADFYSRLGMTFSHGDYAQIEQIPHKDTTAEACYLKSIEYGPNPRAYLGLGMLNQKKQAFEKAVDILSQGVAHFPDDSELNMCMGVSYLNLQQYQNAASYFKKCPPNRDTAFFLEECHKGLGPK